VSRGLLAISTDDNQERAKASLKAGKPPGPTIGTARSMTSWSMPHAGVAAVISKIAPRRSTTP